MWTSTLQTQDNKNNEEIEHLSNTDTFSVFASLAEQKLCFVIKDDKGLINQVQNQKSIKNYKSGVLNGKRHPNYVFYHIHWAPTLL